MLRLLVWQKFADVLEVLTACTITAIALMMEAENTSETPLNNYQTTLRNIPEESSSSPTVLSKPHRKAVIF
jgi:hypothetical protein